MATEFAIRWLKPGIDIDWRGPLRKPYPVFSQTQASEWLAECRRTDPDFEFELVRRLIGDWVKA